MANIIVDCSQKGALGTKINDLVNEDSIIYISSSNLTIFAVNELKNIFSKAKRIYFLFNKPTFIDRNYLNIEQNIIGQINTRENNISELENELFYKNNLNQTLIANDVKQIIQTKFEIKSVLSDNFSSRDILIKNKNSSYRISGYELELSIKGLGFSKESYEEANISDNDEEISRRLNRFLELWNNNKKTIDVKQQVLQCLARLSNDVTPRELYFLTLYNIFKNKLLNKDEYNNIQENVGIKHTKIWNMLFDFQKDAVIGAIHKLQKYNGCIIADSVGLGKTFEALAIIKYYLLKNARVLVLCPKKLRDNWTGFRENSSTNPLNDDKLWYDVLNHTDLSREFGKSGDIDLAKINWGNYDLLVIDESHAFKNDSAVKDRITRYKKLMNEVIKKGVNTKVLMLSATPVNNTLKDLNNQIRIITGDDDQFLLKKEKNIPSIQNTLRIATTDFGNWQKNSNFDDKSTQKLLSTLRFDFFELLDTFTIARSRDHIKKYYDTNQIGKFPIRLKPISITNKIDNENKFPKIKDANDLILQINLAAYSPLLYVMPNKLGKYEELYSTDVETGAHFKALDRAKSVIKLITTNILKRLESSIESFRLTISRILDKTNSILYQIKQANNKNIDDVENFDDFVEDLDSETDILVGDKIKIDIRDIDTIKYSNELQEDKEILTKLLLCANEISPKIDAKLENLKKTISNKIRNPLNGNNKKIIIFTAFADTALYLYKNLEKWIKDEFGLYSGMVTGSQSGVLTNLKTIKNNFSEILRNFSPVSSQLPSVDKEIDILIATDCISEGQNLQDCDTLVNYDIHWNPIKVIQRFGRIDRIGSKNDRIQLINFWPDASLDEYINLIKRVKSKAALVNISGAGSDNLLSEGEDKELLYRTKQLQALKNEVIDLEDAKGGISITDLTLSDYVLALDTYIKDNKLDLEKYPTGLYSVTSKQIDDQKQKDLIKSGVIFCLKQLKQDNSKKHTNIYPYYLVYVLDDGKIYVENIHPKLTLDLFNCLTKDKDKLNLELISLFKQETKNMTDMLKYKQLLHKTFESLKGNIKEEEMQSLFGLGTTTDVSNINVDDFQLISYMVVK